MDRRKLGNKGFAITTIIFGLVVLFLFLLLSMLGILALNKGNLEKLIENGNGARNIATMKVQNASSLTVLKQSGNAPGGLYCFTGNGQKTCRYVSRNELVPSNDDGTVSLDEELKYNKNEPYRKVIIPYSGYYYVEAVGGKGGTASYNGIIANGGNPAFASGYIYFNAGEVVYLFAGGPGTVTSYGSTSSIVGGFNGGGTAKGKASQIIGSGGGASDIRYGDNFGDLSGTDISSAVTYPDKKNTKVTYTLTVPEASIGTYQIEVYGQMANTCTYTNKSNTTIKKNYGSDGHRTIYLTTSKNTFAITATCTMANGDYSANKQYIERIIYSKLEDRILVAAGGGGAVYHKDTEYGIGGGGGRLSGTVGKLLTLKNGAVSSTTSKGGAGTQTSAGSSGGYFAYGGYGDGTAGTAGGGGGYYGGGSNTGGGGGGSSYISGYAGVNSVSDNKIATHNATTLHYSGKYFVNSKMANDYKNETSRVSIKYYGQNLPTTNNSYLKNVRYVKDCIDGNSANTNNHWDEVQIIKNGVNLAKGKTPTGTVSQNADYKYVNMTDGDITNSKYAQSSKAGLQCVTIDLGAVYNLDEIAIWHYYSGDRYYKKRVTSVSSDGAMWIPVLDEADNIVETYEGRRVSAWDKAYDYIASYTGQFIINDFKTYQNSYIKIDNNNWNVKFLSSGTLKTFSTNLNTDLFLVGGGGGGSSSSPGGGGGGGYTKTEKNYVLIANNQYKITIGDGGALNTNGGSTTVASSTNVVLLEANGGYGSTTAVGGNGGSGGGGGGGSSNKGGNGGSNGGNGVDGDKGTGGGGCVNIANALNCSNSNGTRAFSDSNGALYAGGGGGSYSKSGGDGGGGKTGVVGTANTGGGGGRNAAGGSGVIIMRNVYVKADATSDNRIDVSVGYLTNKVVYYCVNSSATSTTSCTSANWIKISRNTFTTSQYGVGNYYVHIKDDIDNIYHSSVVKITDALKNSTYSFDSQTSSGYDKSKYYVMLKDNGLLTINKTVKVEMFLVSAGLDGTCGSTNTLAAQNNCSGGAGGAGGKTKNLTTILEPGTYKVQIGGSSTGVNASSVSKETNIYKCLEGSNKCYQLIASISGNAGNGGAGASYSVSGGNVTGTAAKSGQKGVLAFGGNTDLTTYFAAGGGGADCSAQAPGLGGYNSGGDGGKVGANKGENGVANTGGGGGGSAFGGTNCTTIGKGGTGVIIIRAFN